MENIEVPDSDDDCALPRPAKSARLLGDGNDGNGNDDVVSVHSDETISIGDVGSDDDEDAWRERANDRSQVRFVLCSSIVLPLLTPLYTATDLYDWFCCGCPLIIIRILAQILPTLEAI